MADTNLPESATNSATFRLSSLSDFQRLQYYYAAQPNSPAPGTERGIFSLGADRKWSGEWNSQVVTRPTRQQLNAITPEQADLFRRAGKYVNGAWQIATSRTNIPLATLSVNAESYARLRAITELDAAARKLVNAEKALEALTSRTE